MLATPGHRRESRSRAARHGPTRIVRASASRRGATDGHSRCPTPTAVRSRSPARSPRPAPAAPHEPAAGMNPSETANSWATSCASRSRPHHRPDRARHAAGGKACARGSWPFDHGIKITEGSFAEVRTHPDVIEAYLGHRAAAAARKHGPAATRQRHGVLRPDPRAERRQHQHRVRRNRLPARR